MTPLPLPTISAGLALLSSLPQAPMTPPPLPWTPADVALLGDPDRDGRQIALLRARLVVRVSALPRPGRLALDVPAGLEADQDGLATEWKSGGDLQDLAPKTLPLAERLAFALDQAVGAGAWRLRQALLGWADAAGPEDLATHQNVQVHLAEGPRRSASLRLLSQGGILASLDEPLPPAASRRILALRSLESPLLRQTSRLPWSAPSGHARLERRAAWDAFLRSAGA